LLTVLKELQGSQIELRQNGRGSGMNFGMHQGLGGVPMKTILIFSLLASSLAMAQEQVATPVRSSVEIETSCRVRAKEIAAETYKSCVSDQKNAQIEQIKKEYQDKLQALKAHYEAELKKMNAAKASKESMDEGEAVAPGTTQEKVEKKNDETVSKEAVSSPAPVTKASSKKTSKSTAAKSTVKALVSRRVGKKGSVKSASASPTEMTVRLKPAPITPPADESVMDLPEPIPVETTKTDSAI
jgi:hypothetical protein